MALLIPGKTCCSLCGKPVVSDARLFPAFLAPSHRLHRFSDGVFHGECYLTWEERHEFEELHQKFQLIFSRRPMGATLEEAESWAKAAFGETFK
jgi:hypothetical protein